MAYAIDGKKMDLSGIPGYKVLHIFYVNFEVRAEFLAIATEMELETETKSIGCSALDHLLFVFKAAPVEQLWEFARSFAPHLETLRLMNQFMIYD
jgi:hypothetical protein